MTTDGPTKAELTRTRLLSAAVEAFAEKGFHATTTRDIALASGLSSAALYVHHRSKEELLYLISRSGHEQTLSRIRNAVASSEDPRRQLWQLVHDFVSHQAREHTTGRVINYEMAALSTEHLAEIKAIRQRIDREIRAVIANGIAAGQFTTPEPRMASVAIQSLGVDVARWYRDGRWAPEHIAAQYADMALRLVGAGAVETP
jgi:AcrR family transcriptional regulator